MLTPVSLLGVLVAGWTALAAGPPSWQPWVHLPAIFDLTTPRASDGQLVAAAGGRLFLVSPVGTVTPFAQGVNGYHYASGPEAYLARSPGLHVAAAGCDFPPDNLYILQPQSPFGITRVDPQGTASSFVTISGLDSLNGITFDTVGRFDHRLLVTGPSQQRSTVLAIDCKGGIVPVTRSAAPLEGGLAVAPAGFGAHGGELIAPDENSGAILAINATGQSTVLVDSGIPHGGDIGVESAEFVPPGFGGGGFAYLADRATTNNPHPGTDSVLRMSSAELVGAGVRDGDLLVSAEGGAITIDVRCASACTSSTVVVTGTTAHVEGHLVLVPSKLSATPAPLPAVSDIGSQRAQLLTRIGVGLLVLAAALLTVGLLRASRR